MLSRQCPRTFALADAIEVHSADRQVKFLVHVLGRLLGLTGLALRRLRDAAIPAPKLAIVLLWDRRHRQPSEGAAASGGESVRDAAPA